MTAKYWVGGGSSTNWNATGPTNWSLSDGGAGNAAVPAAGDNVFFTANSGTGASNWNTSISLTGLDCTGSKNTVTHAASITITLSSGNLVLPDGVGATYSAAGSASGFTLTGTVGTQTVKSNSKNLGFLTFNGAGGTFQLLDNLNVTANTSSALTLTAGTFDAQTFTVTCSIFSSSNANTRAIKGTGAWTVNNTVSGAVPFLCTTSTNLTTTLFTSTITFTGNAAGSRALAFGTRTWANPIVLDANTGGGWTSFGNNTNNTFPSLTINGPHRVYVGNTNTETFTGAITVNGTSSAPVFFGNTTEGSTSATWSAGSNSTYTWAGFADSNFAGAGTHTATNSLDLGNNTGITITAPGTSLPRTGLQAIEEGQFP